MMLPDDMRTPSFDAKDIESKDLDIMLHTTSAESEVRNLPVAYRKCRFSDENNLQYYSVSFRPLPVPIASNQNSNMSF